MGAAALAAACSREPVTESVARSPDEAGMAWQASIPAGALSGGMVVSSDRLLLTSRERLLSIDANTGTLVSEFRNPSGEMLSQPTVVDDTLTVVTDSRSVIGLERSGREAWRYAFGPAALDGEKLAAQPCLVTPDGTVLASGVDGYIHAVDRTGQGRWRAHVGTYGAGKAAVPLATTPDYLLVDTRPSPSDKPSLVAVDLHDGHQLRFSIDLGIDVSGLVGGGRAGIVATTYTETKSRRGASRLVALDERGRQRWVVDRGRHEAVHAVTPAGEVLTVSQNADDAEPDSRLELWSSDGERMHEQPLDLRVVALLLGSDETLYVVGCQEHSAAVLTFKHDLAPAAPLSVEAACPQAATLDDRGRLLLIAAKPLAAATSDGSLRLSRVLTPSPAPAPSWSVPRGRASGSGAFSTAL